MPPTLNEVLHSPPSLSAFTLCAMHYALCIDFLFTYTFCCNFKNTLQRKDLYLICGCFGVQKSVRLPIK